MFGSVVLEVVLGLVFTYAWFSLACSVCIEVLEAVRGQRGRQLAIAIERMLGSESKERFYRHGIIRSLSKPGRLPSYLSPRSFATVALHVSGIDSVEYRRQLEALTGDSADTLRSIANGANSYEEVVARLEHWFDDSMDRCSGWFRRRARITSVVVGCVLATLMNVDSLEIAATIYSDTHLRLSAIAPSEAEGQVPIGRRFGASWLGRRASDPTPTVMSIPIESGSLPLGWENSRFVTRAEWADDAFRRPAFWLGPVLSKLLGLFMTALAGSLGAVFWYEALCRVMAVRKYRLPSDRTVLGSCAVVRRDADSRPGSPPSGSP